MLVALTTAEWAQVGAAFFTALAAGVALFTVIRAERDRRSRQLPEFQIESIRDIPNDEARLTIINYGGPAREVWVAGVEGAYGYAGLVPPTAQWRPGESRTIRLSMPTLPETGAEESKTVVIARDLRMRYTLATTTGGNKKRWRIWKWTKISAASTYEHFFPGEPGPMDVPRSPVHMEVIDRKW